MKLLKVSLAAVLFAMVLPAGIEDRAVDLASRVKTWEPFLESRASLVVWITLCVIILGALPGLLAMSNKSWMKVVTAAFGAVVTILTAIKSQVLYADKESYNALRITATTLVDQIEQDAKALKDSREANPEGLAPEEAADFKRTFEVHLANMQTLNERATNLHLPLLRPAPKVNTLRGSLSDLWPASTVLAAQEVTGAAYSATGEGICSTTFASREYARYEARRKTALLIKPDATHERLDAVLAGTEGSMRDMRSRFVRDAGSGIFRHWADASMDRALAYPNYLRTDVWTKPSVRITGSATGPASQSGRVPVRVNQGGGGDFLFHLDFVPQKGGTRVSVAEVHVLNDDSGGSTRWFFEVQVAGRRVIWIPTHRYDDGGKPTRCFPSAEENLSGVVTAGGASGLPIRILGFKPKDF